MKRQLKIILLMLIFLIAAYLIIQALMTWAALEAAKSDDYFFIRTGWVSEPVLEVR
jgi:hypothetical protein